MAAEEYDVVNRPAHYNPEDPAYECVKVAEAWGLDKDAYLFNLLKYICRAGKKDPAKVIEDLEKGAWFLARRIFTLKRELLQVPAAQIMRKEINAC